MKHPDKNHQMKKYLVLICVVLVFIVISTALAGYVSTNNIPNEVKQEFEKMKDWEFLKTSISDLSEKDSKLRNGKINLVLAMANIIHMFQYR